MKPCVICGARTWPLLRAHIGRFSRRAPEPWPWPKFNVVYFCWRDEYLREDYLRR